MPAATGVTGIPWTTLLSHMASLRVVPTRRRCAMPQCPRLTCPFPPSRPQRGARGGGAGAGAGARGRGAGARRGRVSTQGP